MCRLLLETTLHSNDRGNPFGNNFIKRNLFTKMHCYMNEMNKKTQESHGCKQQVFRSGKNKDNQDLPVKGKTNVSEACNSADIVSKVARPEKQARKQRSNLHC